MYNIVNKIKSATASLHDHLEQQLGIEKIQNQQFSLKDTQNIVALHYAFFNQYHAVMENAVLENTHLNELVNNYLLMHQEAFKQDKSWLETYLDNLTDQHNLPKLSVNGLGYLYVYIGSSLGNAYISNKLKSSSNFETHEIPAFFSINMPKELWPNFIKYLEEKVENIDDLIEEIKQAYTFYNQTLITIQSN